MSKEKHENLKILGDNFFFIVDNLSNKLYKNFDRIGPILNLSNDEYLWELQIFVNKFIRLQSQSHKNLIYFCKDLRVKLDEKKYYSDFYKILNDTFIDYFSLDKSKINLVN